MSKNHLKNGAKIGPRQVRTREYVRRQKGAEAVTVAKLHKKMRPLTSSLTNMGPLRHIHEARRTLPDSDKSGGPFSAIIVCPKHSSSKWSL